MSTPDRIQKSIKSDTLASALGLPKGFRLLAIIPKPTLEDGQEVYVFEGYVGKEKP